MDMFHVRQASDGDFDEICAIEDASFSSPYPHHLVQRLLREHSESFFVACDESGKPVGYCVSDLDAKSAHVVSMAVLPSHRRRGIASAFLENIISQAVVLGIEEIQLEVSLKNKEAVSLYRKFGFVELGVVSRYYPDGSGALRMQLLLPNPTPRPVAREEG